MLFKKRFTWYCVLSAMILLIFKSASADITSVTTVIDTIPIGAAVNDLHSGEDHYFVQSLLISVDGSSNAFADDDDIQITIPAGIYLADPDGDSDYDEGVYVSLTSAGGDPTITITATASTIYLDLADGGTNGPANGVATLLVIFPIITSSTLTDGDTYDYSVAHYDDSGAATVGTDATCTVTVRSTLNLVSFDTSLDHLYGGDDETNDEGNLYPAGGAAALTAALPDFITEQTGLAFDESINASGDTDFDIATLDNTDGDEITYYLWASQQDNLKKINVETAVAFQAGYLLNDVLTQMTDNEDIGNAQFDTQNLAPINLEEGDWYFYVTSNWTSDWVLGMSDVLSVKHYPTFEGSNNEGAGVDFDDDGEVEPDVDPAVATLQDGDDVSSVTLDGSGALHMDGNFTSGDASETASDNIDFYHAVRDWDDDDDATVQIFRSTSNSLTSDDITTSGTSPNLLVTGLTGADEITSSPDPAELPYGFYNWEAVRSPDDYDPADDYYIYMIANDGKHQTIKLLSDNSGTELEIKVTFFPYFVFDNDVYTFTANNYNFDTATDQYFLFNWGETIDGDGGTPGDNDIDTETENMFIKLYVSPDNWGSSGYNDSPGSVDLSDLTDNGTLITTIEDSSDTKEENRYMWNVRNSELAPGVYYPYAYIESGSDEFIVPMNSGETMTNDGSQYSITISHGTYFLPKTPVEGDVISLGQSDTYELKWYAFDKNATENGRVAAFIVPENETSPPSAGNNWDQIDETDGWYWLTTSDDGENEIAWDNAPKLKDGTITIDIGVLTTEMDGNGSAPSGTYDVWYLYDDGIDAGSNDTWDDGSAGDAAGDGITIKADGQLYFNGSEDVNAAYNYRLEPTKAVLQEGDTLEISVIATEGGNVHPVALNIYIDVPSENFTVINESEPFTEIVVDPGTDFDGNINKNNLTLSDGVYQLDFESLLPPVPTYTGVEVNNDIVATFKVIAADYSDDSVLENIDIQFSTTGERITCMVDANFVSYGKSTPAIAATYSLAPGGTISGFVDVEGTPTDLGEIVSFYVCPEGSYKCIENTTFLSENDDTDASDGIQVTLGANGSYTLDHVPAGKYDILCEKMGWLLEIQEAKTVQPYSATTVNFTNNYRLLAGDAAGYDDGDATTITSPDNQINSDDITAYETAYDATPEDDSWNTLCDINGDETIDLTDLQWPAMNYGTNYNDGTTTNLIYKESELVNKNVSVRLKQINESGDLTTFRINAENCNGLHSYETRISIDNNWSLESVQNKLKSSRKYFFNKNSGNETVFVSTTFGSKVSSDDNPVLAEFTLRRKSSKASEPQLTSALLIDVNHNIYTPSLVTAVEENVTLPVEFSLKQNYPNPFNPSTTIDFAIPEEGEVMLEVYNLIGQKIRTLVSYKMKAGHYQAVWDARNDRGVKVSSGVYFYHLNVEGKFNKTYKMILMK